MSLSGNIKKILKAEGYGFIKADNGKEFFFHKSKCITSFDDLQQDQLVEFKEVVTKKGVEAVDLMRIKRLPSKRKIAGFVFTKESNPRHGDVERRVPMTTPWFNDPNEAREFLKRAATKSGANAVLNLTLERKTRSKGSNYKGTYHSYTADLAIVVEKIFIPLSEKAKVDEMNLLIEDIISKLLVETSKSDSAKSRQDFTDGCLPIIGLVVVVLAVIIYIGSAMSR